MMDSKNPIPIIDYPIFKSSKKQGSPGLALTWCLLNNKGILGNEHLSSSSNKICKVLLGTNFNSFGVSSYNEPSVYIVATGYINTEQFQCIKDIEPIVFTLDGIKDWQQFDSKWCYYDEMKKESNGLLFDIFKDEKCEEIGWNLNSDFFQFIYSINTQLKDDCSNIDSVLPLGSAKDLKPKWQSDFPSVTDSIKYYNNYVKPIIQHLRDNKVGINDTDVNKGFDESENALHLEGKPTKVPNTHCQKSYHNILISGTPGIGKSYLVENYIVPKIIAENKEFKEYEAEKDVKYSTEKAKKAAKKKVQAKFTKRITFTSSTSYEDFFGCYKPVMDNGSIAYKFTPGVFSEILKKAILNVDNNYVLIIEEINRADVYDVFGQIFQLLDRYTDESLDDDVDTLMCQDSEYGISIPADANDYFSSNEDDEPLENETIFMNRFGANEMHIPANLFIIGTLNSADQGVRVLDTAFKRRFSMVYVNVKQQVFCSSKVPLNEFPVIEGKQNFTLITSTQPQNVIKFEDYVEYYLKPINNTIKNDNLSEDKMVAQNFIKIGEDGLEEIEFIINVLGYLVQNVYKNRTLPENIFGKRNNASLYDLLKDYIKDCNYSLSNICQLGPPQNK